MANVGRSLERRAARIESRVNVIVKDICRGTTRSLVIWTPVDTGEARSNWILSLGVPIQGTIAPYTPYPKRSQGNGRGRAETANTDGALTRAEGAIAARLPGQTVIIQNNVPYIGLLNDGSSVQAPANFVQLAMKEGVKTVQGRKVRIIS